MPYNPTMIYLGADHGGFALKEKIKLWLTEWGYEFVDMGAKHMDSSDDYPQFAFAVAEKVGKEDGVTKVWKDRSKGILICRSSAGMVIAANKVKNVRAVAVFDETSAKHSREHSDANVIGISGDWTNEADSKKIIKMWLDTDYSYAHRHERRLQKIKQYENK